MKNQTGLIDVKWSGDQITSLSDSAGRTVTYGYDGDNLTSVTNPDGDRLEYEYDAKGFLTKCWDYDGNLYLENEYDEQGRVVSQDLYTEGGTSTSTITYDDEKMVTTARSGDGEVRKFYYDEHRNILSVEEEEGTSEVRSQVFSVVGGNSYDAGYNMNSFINEISKNGVKKAAAKALKSISTNVAKNLNKIDTAISVGVAGMKSIDIAMTDDVVFKLAQLAHVQLEGTTDFQVKDMMNNAYEFVLSNQNYFFGTPWAGSKTYFEIQLDLYQTSPKEVGDKMLEYYRKYYCVLDGKILFDKDGKIIDRVGKTKISDDFNYFILNQYMNIIDVAEAFKSYIRYGKGEATWSSSS